MSQVAETAASSDCLPEPMVLRGVRYDEYLAYRKEPENSHLRMTYYDGTLEMAWPEFIYDQASRRMRTLIWIACETSDVDYEGAGSTTMCRGVTGRKRGYGKEPDECYYFANARRILGNEQIDLEVDPPPDLWLEVDDRADSKGKLPLYAALRVPEVWRLQAETKQLWFGRLSNDGFSYEKIDRSLCIPLLTPALALEALALGQGMATGSWTRTVRAWIREKWVASGSLAP